MILKKNKDASSQLNDRGVSEAWEFIERHWEVARPEMMISVTGGKRQFFMNQRLQRSFKRGLMKAAIAAGTSAYRQHSNIYLFIYLSTEDELDVDKSSGSTTRLAKTLTVACLKKTRSSAIAEGPREALVSRNPATTKHLT